MLRAPSDQAVFKMAVLSGLRVLEFGSLAPAPVPFAGMILADFGAVVTRIDRVKTMDIDRLARGKRSIAIDLQNPRGKEIARKLCLKSDVLIEPFRPGVMERHGLGPEILLKDNPRLIYARLTGKVSFFSFCVLGIQRQRAWHVHTRRRSLSRNRRTFCCWCTTISMMIHVKFSLLKTALINTVVRMLIFPL